MSKSLNLDTLKNRAVRVECNDRSGKISVHKAVLQYSREDAWILLFELSELPIVNPQTDLIIAAQLDEDGQEVHFKTKVTDVFFGQATLYISRPEPVDISALRQFFRCEVRFPVQLDIGTSTVKGYAQNLSAGGMMIQILGENPVANGRRVSCQFNLPGYTQPMTIRGEVVRSERRENGRLGIAVKFLIIHEKNQNDIIQFLFRCQREALQARKRPG